MNSNRVWLYVVAVAMLAPIAPAQQQEQSLGEVARQVRAKKKPAKRVITNDDLAPAPPPASAPPEPTAQSPNVASAESPKDAAEAERQKHQEFRARYTAQKQRLQKTQAELAALQKELQQRVAGYYGDAGNRLRDDKAWADKQRKLENEIAEKHKQIEALQLVLDDTREQARRAGVPERILED